MKTFILTGATLLSAITSANPISQAGTQQYTNRNATTSDSAFATYLQYADAAYHLVDTYSSSNFFSSFNFFTGADPTHGYVNYQSQSNAQSANLINTNNNQVHLGVDSSTYNPGSAGRKSVRVTSNKAYTHGLFIADIAHMPGSICGVWPAYWLFGPNWPASGEIDIIEGVNLASIDQATLHTSAGCTVNIAGSQSSTTLVQSNCNANNGNDGCGAVTNVPYGDSFNNIGGGVYAMQWESSGVYIWFWPRGSVPSDVTNGNPVTGNWGLPIVAFNGGSGCTFDNHFMNQNIVFDTTFCGDWAGSSSVWGSSSCASKGSCNDYVAQNPGVFANAYWTINSIKVYSL